MRRLIGSVLRDAAHALRQFRRAKLFAAGVVLSLGFGIGSSATVFSWMQGMLLRPLPAVPRFEELITVRPDSAHGWGISLEEYREWRDNAKSVSALAAVNFTMFAVQPETTASASTSTPVYGMFVSANYFSVLGVAPAGGRFFVHGDDAPESPLVAVISDAARKRFFGDATDVVNRSVRLNGRLVRVVGVAPPRFGGNLAIAQFDVFVPLNGRAHLEPSYTAALTRRDARWLDAIGRLAPGATLVQASAEFRAIAARQAATFRENEGRSAQAIPLDVGSAEQLAPLFAALIAVTSLVVLLICCNVANLLLTRAATRQRELGIRLSVGAGRARLIRQLLTESMVLALVGGALGAVVGISSGALLDQFMPPSYITFQVHSTVDARFLGFVAAVTGLCVLTFGLAPAVLGSRVDLMALMKAGTDHAGPAVGWLRRGLVGTQFAFALAILVSLSVFLRRDRNVNAMDLGFRNGQQVLLLQTEMSLAGYADSTRWRQTMETAVDRLRQLPGISRVSLGAFVPLGLFGFNRQVVDVPGYPADPDSPERVLVNTVSADYFETMEIDLLDGRGITSQDTHDVAPVAVVNQAFASRYFAGVTPIGRTFRLRGADLRVVGVAPNGRYDYRDIDNDRMPLVYTAWSQASAGLVTIHLRTMDDPMSMAIAARRVVQEVDPSIPFLPAMTLRAYADVPFAISRSAATILRGLGFVALVLASVGLFAIVSYGVTLRTREIGIRLAIGAGQPAIIRDVVHSALGMTLVGTVVGTATAMSLLILIRSQLPMLPAMEARDFALPLVLLTASAIVAALSPAHRAASIDPARTLRSD
jgi:predicted permease